MPDAHAVVARPVASRHRGRGCPGHRRRLRPGPSARLRQLRRPRIRDRERARPGGPLAGRCLLGVRRTPRGQLAPIHLALAHARRSALRAGARRPSCDQRPAPRDERRAPLRGARRHDRHPVAERVRRRGVRAAPAPGRVRRVGLGAEGRAGRLLLDARARGVRALRATTRRGGLRPRRRRLRPGTPRKADGGDAADGSAPPRRLAAPPAVEHRSRVGEAAARPARGGRERAHGRGPARRGGHGLARVPAAGGANGRGGRRLPGLPGEDVLAGAARGLLSAPAAADRGGRGLLRRAPRRLGARHPRAPTPPLVARGVALVPRHAPAGHRARQGGRAGHGRSLHLPAADRRAHHGHVDRGGDGRLACRSRRDGRRGGGGLRRAHDPAARGVARQRVAVRACDGRDTRQLRRRGEPRRRAPRPGAPRRSRRSPPAGGDDQSGLRQGAREPREGARRKRRSRGRAPRIRRRHPARPEQPHRALQSRARARGAGTAGRRDRRVPRGSPPRSGVREGAPQPGRRARRPGPFRGGGRRVPPRARAGTRSRGHARQPRDRARAPRPLRGGGGGVP